MRAHVYKILAFTKSSLSRKPIKTFRICKRGCSVWVKSLRFSIIVLFMECKRANFCMSFYHHIRELVVQEFFPKGTEIPENEKNWISFVSTLLPKYIKIKSLPKYKLTCSRVVKISGLNPALISCNHSIRGLSPDGVGFTDNISFYFEFVYCLPAFHC